MNTLWSSKKPNVAIMILIITSYPAPDSGSRCEVYAVCAVCAVCACMCSMCMYGVCEACLLIQLSCLACGCSRKQAYVSSWGCSASKTYFLPLATEGRLLRFFVYVVPLSQKQTRARGSTVLSLTNTYLKYLNVPDHHWPCLDAILHSRAAQNNSINTAVSVRAIIISTAEAQAWCIPK